jgi:hypothetical protein
LGAIQLRSNPEKNLSHPSEDRFSAKAVGVEKKSWVGKKETAGSLKVSRVGPAILSTHSSPLAADIGIH